jgi:signal transduction histidine kinase
MRSLGRALIGLAALGLVMGVAAGAIILTSRHMSDRGTWAVFSTALGGSFVGTGLYAWWRRPENHSGALMTWVGFVWFLSALSFSDAPALFVAGNFTEPLPIAALGHLLLAVPRGRLESRYHRGLVALGYLNATLLQLPGFLVSDTSKDSICEGCPANPLLIGANDQLAEVGAGVVNLIAVVVIALITRELIRRVRRSRTRERDAYRPLVYAGAATLAAFACLFASFLVGGPGATVLRFGAFAAFVTVPYAFLISLIRGRLSRATAVAELVEALGRADDRRTSLRASIAGALGDSSLTLAYWIPQVQAYVDAEGRRVELPPPDSGRIATPIERGGAPLALVIHDAALAEERDLVRAVGGAAALTLENERLSAELRARIDELHASRARIVRAGDEERRRLERDLHDGAQQRLVTLALNLRLVRDSDDPVAMRNLADEAIRELIEATAELRELARGIHPAVLTDLGLKAAVNALAGRAQVPVEVRAVPEERLASAVESTVYFVVAEALTNVTRYAQASHAVVEIARENGSLVVEVRDDGIGGADPGQGSGLRGLADRVAAVDGRLVVRGEPGAGTIVRAEIPCAP